MARSAAKLRIVPDEPVDIHAIGRAAIEARDWGAVHIAADKRAPVALADARKRGWRG